MQSTLYAGKESHNESRFILQWINEKESQPTKQNQEHLKSLGPALRTLRLWKMGKESQFPKPGESRVL